MKQRIDLILGKSYRGIHLMDRIQNRQRIATKMSDACGIFSCATNFTRTSVYADVDGDGSGVERLRVEAWFGLSLVWIKLGVFEAWGR